MEGRLKSKCLLHSSALCLTSWKQQQHISSFSTNNKIPALLLHFFQQPQYSCTSYPFFQQPFLPQYITTNRLKEFPVVNSATLDLNFNSLSYLVLEQPLSMLPTHFSPYQNQRWRFSFTEVVPLTAEGHNDLGLSSTIPWFRNGMNKWNQNCLVRPWWQN